MEIVELKHGSHDCVLTSPEIVADGICNMCFKDEPVEFACNTCNFDLCKACSKIPQKVAHDFHPKHSLEFCVPKDDEESQDMLCSGCGTLFSKSFYYKCKECEIYLDLSCALLKNINTGWDAKEILHYSHVHLIRRCRPGPKVNGSCLLCELPLSPSSICYGCVQCNSFVHERCLDFPRKYQHPAHPLIRLDFKYNCGLGKSCKVCGLHIDGAPLGCPECDFFLHLRCADFWLRGLMHKSHHHKLLYVAHTGRFIGRNNSCQICLREISYHDSFFQCVECQLKFHTECLGIPKSVVKKPYHVHPLVYKVFKPKDTSLEYCGVCETVAHIGCNAYLCEECDFVGHIECILTEKTPSPLYLKDLYSCGDDMPRPIDQEDCKTKEYENKLLLNDLMHTHVLTLGDIKEFRVFCKICDEDILDRPWGCAREMFIPST